MELNLKCFFVVTLTLLGGIFCVPFASTADSTLTIAGNIIASGCTVRYPTPTVMIGVFSGKDFPTVGSTTAFKAMNIDLKDCYSKLKNVQVSFSGVTDKDNPALLAITDIGKDKVLATGVGVELLDNNFKTLPFNSEKPLVYELDGEENTLSFLMRYKSTKAQVTPGDASAVMCFDLIYQ